MSDLVEIPASAISFVQFCTSEKNPPRTLASSEDGILAILHPNSLLIGVVGCDPRNEDTKYLFNPEKVAIDFSHETVLKVADFDFKKPIQDNMIDDGIIYTLMLKTDFTISSGGTVAELHKIEWSPLDVVSNSSFLAVSRFDGRLIIMGLNNISNRWEKEFDITDLYFKYYKEKMLKSILELNIARCIDVNEYIQLKNDLKLIDFSWSLLIRQYMGHQYGLMATLSSSGIVSVWRIIIDQMSNHCDLMFCERFNVEKAQFSNIKLCDISENSFMICIINSNDIITLHPYSIVESKNLTLEKMSPSFTINQQARFCQMNCIQWSMKHSQLIIGFEWKLVISKIIIKEHGNFENECAVLYLPSNCEISGLYIKNNTCYVTSVDGCLFGIKLNTVVTNIELSQIVLQHPELKSGHQFFDVFVSPNSIYLGFLTKLIDTPNNSRKYVANIALVGLVNESQALNVLMDDNIPFCRKQDAVEEVRHSYFNVKHGLHECLRKIGKSDVQWYNSSLHRLQYVRYICIFFGYKLNVNHELTKGLSVDKFEDIEKIRKLESIIIIKNISYWLDGFCEIDDGDIVKDDCIFALNVIRKLKLLPDNHISDTIEAAEGKCLKVLKEKFRVSDNEVASYTETIDDVTCVVCGEKCPFNLFASKCSNNHILPRCCKSLEICTNKVKLCRLCGASEKYDSNIKDISSWRWEIINSNCPLCDGKLLHVNF